MIPRVLTIGASDSSGAAGVQADLKTLQTCEVYGLTALTAVTAQGESGIRSVQRLPAEFVRAQIEAVWEPPPQAVKTGLLFDAGTIEAIASIMQDRNVPLVVDPVLVTGEGKRLLDDAALKAYFESLFPLAELITPNADEAHLLTGITIVNPAGLREAAQALHRLSQSRFVLIKGGHLHSGNCVIDVLYDGQQFHEFEGERLPVDNPRGAGDVFAACIAAERAKGRSMIEAVQTARRLLEGTIRHAITWQHEAKSRAVLWHGQGTPH